MTQLSHLFQAKFSYTCGTFMRVGVAQWLARWPEDGPGSILAPALHPRLSWRKMYYGTQMRRSAQIRKTRHRGRPGVLGIVVGTVLYQYCRALPLRNHTNKQLPTQAPHPPKKDFRDPDEPAALQGDQPTPKNMKFLIFFSTIGSHFGHPGSGFSRPDLIRTVTKRAPDP